MTDREIVFALLGLRGPSTDHLIASLNLLKREVPFSTIIECKDEMIVMVRNLHELAKPDAEEAKAFVTELLEALRKTRES